MSVLGSSNVTANGNVTIPAGCVYVVAVCVGTTNAPYLNGHLMDKKATVAATGQLKAIGVHVLTFPITEILPFVMNGATNITFFYLDDAVCIRPVAVKGYSAAGQVTGDLATSTDDLAIGIVLGSNGQVQIKGDTAAFTAVYNTTKCRIGWKAPGDSVLSCDATDQSTVSGYWYSPPAYYTDTSSRVLVSAGYWKQVSVYHRRWYQYTRYATNKYWYDKMIYNDPGHAGYPPGTWVELADAESYTVYQGATFGTTVFYTYISVWVPPVYETQTSGYWTYPPQVWIETGIPGEVSCIFVSIANVMIGSVYVTRPLGC